MIEFDLTKFTNKVLFYPSMLITCQIYLKSPLNHLNCFPNVNMGRNLAGAAKGRQMSGNMGVSVRVQSHIYYIEIT